MYRYGFHSIGKQELNFSCHAQRRPSSTLEPGVAAARVFLFFGSRNDGRPILTGGSAVVCLSPR
jgi:hypothetical protein